MQSPGYRMTPQCTQDELVSKTFNTGEQVIVDFGDHYAGYLSFRLGWQGVSYDAPNRVRLVFGEVVTDVDRLLYPYNGWISALWLPTDRCPGPPMCGWRWRKSCRSRKVPPRCNRQWNMRARCGHWRPTCATHMVDALVQSELPQQARQLVESY